MTPQNNKPQTANEAATQLAYDIVDGKITLADALLIILEASMSRQNWEGTKNTKERQG